MNAPLMGRDFFQILPSELTTNILSRLPFRLVALKINPSRCTIFEIEDKDEADLESHDLHYIPLTEFDIPHRSSTTMRFTAADGLLLLHSYIDDPETLHICNPLTREYIVLCCPENYTLVDFMVAFCVSKLSGQYKVVCICRSSEFDYFQVYTIGTGIWRRVEPDAAYGSILFCYGHVEYNGNVNYIVTDFVQPTVQFCGFNVETECFSIFSPPPALALDGNEEFYFKLTVFRDCLCICFIEDYEITIWLMKEYRVEESWTIEYKLSTNDLDSNVEWVYPIKVFKDGDILMRLNGDQFIFYNKTKTTQHVGMLNDANARYFFNVMIFTPSLFSLKSFEFENVISF